MSRYTHYAEAASDGTVGAIDEWTRGYVTEGGTYILADTNCPIDGCDHDLVAILPVPVEGTRVHVLRPTVNPDMVAALRKALDDADGDPCACPDCYSPDDFDGPADFAVACDSCPVHGTGVRA